MSKLCDVDEVRKCLDEVTGDDSIYAKGLLEWAIRKRTVDETDIRADERKKVLDEMERVIYGMDFDFGDFYDHTKRIQEMLTERIEQLKGEQT